MKQKIHNALRKFFLTPSLGWPLSVLRIVVGLGMLIEAVLVFPHLDELYGPYGFLQADVIEALTGHAIPGLLMQMGMSPETYSVVLHGFYVVHIVAALMFALGIFSWWATVGAWITQAMLINSGYLSSYGVDRYFHNLTFLMLFFPIANVLSVDRWRSGKPAKPLPEATAGMRLAQIFILMTYANAGFAKAAGSDWWNGEAIWRVLNQPEFNQYNFIWIAQVPWLAKILSLGTMIVEGFYIVGVWIPYLGTLWVLAIIGMHLGIAASMGLSLFGVTLAGVSAALFLVAPGGSSQAQNWSAKTFLRRS